MRVLSAIRLSQLSEVTTSPERQREHVDKWTRIHDGEVVGQAVDLGVSGGLSPFERPDLSQWISDRPPEPWDVLVAWRLDRVSRDALDTPLLLKWFESRGKRLVTVADNLDSSGPYAKAFITLAAVFAELARTTSLEMSADARAKLRADGKWVGGNIARGYRVGSDGCLEIDPKEAPAVRRAFELAGKGAAAAAIDRELGWPEGRTWKILRNPAYVGLGVPPAPAIIDPEVFEAAQRPPRNPKRKTSGELSGVLHCLKCEQPMWIRRQTSKGRPYWYYTCRNSAHTKGIRFDIAAELVAFQFVNAMGSEPVIDEIVHPDTTDADAALCRVEMATLAGKLADGDRDKILARMTELSAKLTELEKHPGTDRVERVDTGRTWADEVARLTLAELGDELRRRGVRIGVRKLSSKPVEIEVRVLP